jgi:signal transduction histidine kinase
MKSGDRTSKINGLANILVVDDHPANRKLLRAVLEAEGFNTVEAADGVEALAALDREPIDAVVSDILMPRMDGYRLCYEVRASKRFCCLPFIIYTNTYISPNDEKAGLDLGADKFLRKPSAVNEILAALRALNEQPRRARSGRIPPPPGLGLMKEYSAVLVRKLGEKNSELQAADEELARANRVLSSQARELERAKEELLKTNAGLEMRVRERTAQLEASNQELEAFSYSVAHDLRAPLRAIEGFSRIVMQGFSAGCSDEATKYLGNTVKAAHQMNQLITALLNLSRFNRCELTRQPVDLSRLARVILNELQRTQPERNVEIVIAPEIIVSGDKPLLRIVLENLLNNSWKFAGKTGRARIEFGIKQDATPPACFVRDNGAGFDMACAKRLFTPFQRLHPESEFPGAGVGLATVQRIIHRHGGVVWAEGAVGQGATFYFTTATE